MFVVDAIRQALRMLWAQKLRASLTLFGFVWGTASVIFLAGWGDGVREMLERGFAKTGKNMGVIHAGYITADFTPASDRRYLWFNNRDLAAARRSAKWPEQVAGESQQFLFVAYGQNALTVDLRGIEPETADIRGTALVSGRAITRTDLLHRRRVVVLGDGIRRNLLGASGGLGSRVRIAGVPFEVIGFLQPVGVQLSRDGNLIDDQAWVPITTFQANWPKFWTDEPVVDRIIYRARDRRLYQVTHDELRSILAARLGVSVDDRGAVGGWSSMQMLNKLQLDKTRGLMLIIAVTTLLIGGIGVLNMMLDAVHERRQEIGVRMALGARKRDVLLQFFLESFVVSLLGGSAGLVLGVLGCLGLGALGMPDLVPIPILSMSLMITAFVVMLVIGLAAGCLPAWRAIQIDPASTLRME